MMLLRFTKAPELRIDSISEVVALHLPSDVSLFTAFIQYGRVADKDLSAGTEAEWEMLDAPEPLEEILHTPGALQQEVVSHPRFGRWLTSPRGRRQMNQHSATPDKQTGQSSKDSSPSTAPNICNISPQANVATSTVTPHSDPDEDVFADADLARSAWGTDQIPTYISPFSPLFDNYECQGPGQHSNDCQTFYEATDDMHLYQAWPQEKIICYIEEVVIIENHFASDDDGDEENHMWTDGEDGEGGICFVNGGGISADMEPYIKGKGTRWSRAWARSPTRRILPTIAVEVGKMTGWMAQTDARRTLEKEEKKERSARYLATNRTPFYPGHPTIRQPRFMSDITEEDTYVRRRMGRSYVYPVEDEDTCDFELAAPSDEEADAGPSPAVGDEDSGTSSRAQIGTQDYAEYGSNSTPDMAPSEDEASLASYVLPEVISFRRPPRIGPGT